MGKLIEDRLNSAEFVASSVDTHAGAIAAKLSEQLGRHLGRGESIDVQPLLGSLARVLRSNAASLKAASDAHDREVADDDKPRSVRDSLTADLVNELTSFRSAVETTYGPSTVTVLGYDGKTPADPRPALALTRKILGTIAEPKFRWPKPARKGLRLDPAEWIADLSDHASKLDDALKAVTREQREAEQTSATRQSAESTHDAFFSPAAAVISALMNLVGETALSERVRPSTRRPGTVDAEPAPEPVPPTP